MKKTFPRYYLFYFTFSAAIVILIISIAVILFQTGNSPAKPRSTTQTQKSALTRAAPETLSSSDIRLPLKGTTIFLDPGHGGKDPGTVDYGLFEKTLTLQICKKLQQQLENLGATVAASRDRDVHVDLKKRVQAAKKAGADLFISLHLNSVDYDTKSNGIETYYHTSSSPDSILLAGLIQKHLIQATSAKDRGIKQKNFYVIHKTDIPSCLIEAGFLSSAKEQALLQNSSYQDKIAAGITQGILSYLKHQKAVHTV
ncbi:MAG: N-acetylmuramoyl-L-alanine amidase [Lachnospiraceae bacterium]|nr:N-acetylmuramoyl-L-alanine amidase [Lachnospiraceae bacterium]